MTNPFQGFRNATQHRVLNPMRNIQGKILMSDTEKTVTLTIDGQTVTVPDGTMILDAARSLDKNIPVICYHDATTSKGLCRICVVDVNGGRLLQPACVAACQDGMRVETRNERVERSRRTILEMLDSAVDLSQAPEIQTMMETLETTRDDILNR